MLSLFQIQSFKLHHHFINSFVLHRLDQLTSIRQSLSHQSMSLRGCPFGRHTIGKQLYQCDTCGITVYDARPKRVKDIQRRREMDMVYDVCDMPNGDLIGVAVVLNFLSTHLPYNFKPL